ncbi:MAG: ribosome recycling factor [Deltaproteobacteria bacterium CG07_land_8_20_14_0_80_38_7]|nr:MAG: ribosome recycling factor [Deltaproteobacteria bacterium CG07_land_8_20_14_0_80_38_7]
MITKICEEAKKGMQKPIEIYRHDLSKLRTGRASLPILDGIKVEYYGTLTPINQLATLTVPDPRTIAIQPWDTSVVPEVEKAIMKSDLGLNPANDGRVIRLPFPALNEERRRELAKLIKKHGEECKIAIRNIRRDVLARLKKMEDESQITEDDLKKGQDDVQKITDDVIKHVDEIAAHKEKDIMEV